MKIATTTLYLNHSANFAREYHEGDQMQIAYQWEQLITDEPTEADLLIILETCFVLMNISLPKDYQLRSASVGDVFVVEKSAWSINPEGFTRIPNFDTTDHTGLPLARIE